MATATETDVIIDGPGTYLNKNGTRIVILKRNCTGNLWIGVSELSLMTSAYKPCGKCLSSAAKGNTPASIVSKVSDGIDL